MSGVCQLGEIHVPGYHGGPISGREAFRGLIGMSTDVLSRFTNQLRHLGGDKGAAIGTIRGTGPGVSFSALVDALQRDEPRDLRGPFENTDSISGAVWRSVDLLGPGCDTALLKLRFEKGTDALPLHAHVHSDRVIVVLEGRGFFHVMPTTIEKSQAHRVRSIAVRTRDILVFTRGVIHTFTAPSEPLVLLSYHSPFIPLDEPDQYTIAEGRESQDWTRELEPPTIACVPAWTLLTGN